ncbi:MULTISPECIES: flagellar biosynthesis protein FliQ [unclassified Candidatus Frackibacter]|uniref:flagellar biosynthesis protein FliQ n=1 Tax=unclassified Candidatus Frackibacter TaxID=2648818 RepID=UPI000793C001|nr:MULTISPECIES: flagellar biosynthesis protein FliQ [unclassified Candidatus Frackibacter]KXS40614.1 MAG: flagellar biosynthetic protein FliQ [Candidatus Frackibacter sp. T328-2]SDB99333.1 flagellar biosynthetic protein FliQ [Candidatus Frackibacter sp. WG11]SEM30988.1 flagellar biosynthetic protein FliQ [Candidatus Frackibacter sp. WG12]SFL35973.1 flagellar biosynthetic protein FliQ [Candidatus Frackibacter sp. WG13]
MTEQLVIDLGRTALMKVLMVTAPMLGLGLLTGLLVSIFQATTQIQEQTLAFIPKILAVLGAIIVFGPWMLNVLLDFVRNLFINIPSYVG